MAPITIFSHIKTTTFAILGRSRISVMTLGGGSYFPPCREGKLLDPSQRQQRPTCLCQSFTSASYFTFLWCPFQEVLSKQEILGSKVRYTFGTLWYNYSIINELLSELKELGKGTSTLSSSLKWVRNIANLHIFQE